MKRARCTTLTTAPSPHTGIPPIRTKKQAYRNGGYRARRRTKWSVVTRPHGISLWKVQNEAKAQHQCAHSRTVVGGISTSYSAPQVVNVYVYKLQFQRLNKASSSRRWL